MSLEYIRDSYKVPADRGGLITYHDATGGDVRCRIIGAHNAYLKAQPIDDDGEPIKGKRPLILHPKWRVTYHDTQPTTTHE